MKPSFTAVVLTAALIAGATAPRIARAQFAPPPPDQPDMTVDAATRAAVVESLATQVDRRYVFPDVGKQVAKDLRARLKKGRYDSITSAKAFGDTLTADLKSVAHDLHLRVHYSNRPLPVIDPDAHQAPDAEEVARQRAFSEFINYGFEKVQRLPGNIGYLDLRGFDGSPEAGRKAAATMTMLEDTNALIIDLRRNGGGDPNMIALILSYLFPADDRVHINDFYQREGNHTEEYWTSTSVPGPRYTGKDVYVLTSRRTGSAAEEFSYDVKNLKRGTLVGEVTAGGANPGGLFRLNANFAAFIATGRAINPITKTNWEGVGVQPDIAADADSALRIAHVKAVETLLAAAKDDETKGRYQRALDAAKEAPIEALNLPPRRVR